MKSPRLRKGRQRRSWRAKSDAAVLRGQKETVVRAQIMRDHPKLKKQSWRPIANLLRQVEALKAGTNVSR